MGSALPGCPGRQPPAGGEAVGEPAPVEKVKDEAAGCEGEGEGPAPPAAELTWGEYVQTSREAFREVWPVAVSAGLEAYEFSLFAFAITPLKATFFANSSQLAWLCYAVPYYARPFGGVICGWLADRYGRRPVVICVAYAVLASTVAQGVVPSAAGAAGAWVLFGLRVVQGFAFGACSAVGVYAVEVGPRRTLAQPCSIAHAGAVVGGLCSSVAFAALQASLSPAAMVAWGWRVPYLVVVGPGLLAAWRTHGVAETPEFLQARAKADGASPGLCSSLWRIVGHHGGALLLGGGLLVAGTGYNHVSRSYLVEFLPKYAGIPAASAMLLVSLNGIMCLLATPAVSFATDLYGASCVVRWGYGGMVVACPVLFLWVLHPNHSAAPAVVLQLALGAATTLSIPAHILACGLLPTEFRNLGQGLVSNTVSCLFGGSSPALLATLSGSTAMAPALYLSALSGACVLATAAAVALRARGHAVAYLREAPF
eukprot:EG_transcript_9283